ncbi:MAG TPA: hypothetical protein VII56_13270 [Rhizomicrobium sp.]
MSSRLSRLYLAIAFCLPFAGAAQAQVETVVVTGARLHDENEAPHLVFIKRADHVITHLNVTCDTRELSLRRAELKETLRNMIRAAGGTATISLGLGDQIVGDLSESNFDSIIEPDSRADTSHAVVIIKTKVAADDTLNAAIARITAFVNDVPKAGRTEILRQGGWDLTIVGPEQYRDAILKLIVEDARHSAELFGSGYGISIEGLEHQVSWYQKGPLDLGLYIPYALKLTPLQH